MLLLLAISYCLKGLVNLEFCVKIRTGEFLISGLSLVFWEEGKGC